MIRLMGVRGMTFLVLLGCGSRTGISLDSTWIPERDATILDASVLDASPDTVPDALDAQPDAPSCTTPVAQVRIGTTSQKCEMHVTWSCDGTNYLINLGCEEGDPPRQVFYAWCYVNGVETGAWSGYDAVRCSCSDTTKTIDFAIERCKLPFPH